MARRPGETRARSRVAQLAWPPQRDSHAPDRRPGLGAVSQVHGSRQASHVRVSSGDLSVRWFGDRRLTSARLDRHVRLGRTSPTAPCAPTRRAALPTAGARHLRRRRRRVSEKGAASSLGFDSGRFSAPSASVYWSSLRRATLGNRDSTSVASAAELETSSRLRVGLFTSEQSRASCGMPS